MDFTRRVFLKVGGFAGLAAASMGLVACGSNIASSNDSKSDVATLTCCQLKLDIGVALVRLKL